MYADATYSSSAGARTALFFLALMTLIAAYAVVFAAGPIAQSHGDLRTQGLIVVLIVGLAGILFSLFIKPAHRSNASLEIIILLVPAYALLQVTPLPLGVIRILSPARARLVPALSPVMATPTWVTLSVTPSATLYHFLLLAASAVVFLVILNVSNRVSCRPWVVILPLILIAVGEAILGLAQIAGNPDGIAVGTFLIRNHYAGFLEMILPFVALYPFAVLASREEGTRNEIAPALLVCGGVGVSVLLTAGILSSLSRMGFIASLVSMMFVSIAAVSPGRSRRRISLILAGVVVAGLLAFFLIPSARLVMRFGEMDKSNEDRSPVWRETIGLFKAYPIFGCGLGGYESAFLKFKNSNPALNQDYAHNDYLQYLAELGIVGFLLAIAPVAFILVRLRNACRQTRADMRWLSLGCAGSAAAIGLHSFVDFNLYVPANLITLAWILGIAAHAGRAASRDTSLAIEPASIIAAPVKAVRSRSYP